MSELDVIQFSDIFGLTPYSGGAYEATVSKNIILLKIPTTQDGNSNHLEIYENIGFLIENIIRNYRGEVKDLKVLKDLKNEENLKNLALNIEKMINAQDQSDKKV